LRTLLMKCASCKSYTLRATCPNCSSPTVMAMPAKYSPEDRYGEYRRRLKMEMKEGA
jgi:H/ACA ribonucleoprotein complex subunit 3